MQSTSLIGEFRGKDEAILKEKKYDFCSSKQSKMKLTSKSFQSFLSPGPTVASEMFQDSHSKGWEAPWSLYMHIFPPPKMALTVELLETGPT